MPPRPKPIPIPRKQSFSASKDAPKVKFEHTSKSMPPPPVPVTPMGILEPEMNALSTCLQNAAVKTAQVMRFHHDARQLNVRKHASDPPHTLQASLGRELEKYDQLCDAIEAHLIRAISVLQRDVQKEQQRIRDEEKAAAEAIAIKAAVEAAATAPSSPKVLPSSSMESISTSTPIASTNQSPVANSGPAGRRPSTISISSLNRPAFPLKLDLSAQSLRMSAEDATFLGTGLRSPVTLAPKSARPMSEYDYMAAFNNTRVDIDLTLPQEGGSSNDMNIPMGNSADKPIELDMEMDIDQAMMSDLFGDSSEADNSETNADVGALFSPNLGTTGNEGSVNNSFLSSIGVGGGDTNADIFASFNVGAGGDSTVRPDAMTLSTIEPSLAPSPGSIIASLSQSSANGNSVQTEPFDLGNLGFDFPVESNSDSMNLESLWIDSTDGNSGVEEDANKSAGVLS
ncbi:hypothetical protein BDP27DRAFT_1319781 [Rhodocollybia butyracea]|uniref:Uncharacterized protein n=1 Tax=Rhodocollybia butyracea TaxID=206335 RepID=A0A9P5Q0L7_9AGAR|nr:hypothetical protein BDP27DRAFT_1319781 [Rhodocollybia butyracea]